MSCTNIAIIPARGGSKGLAKKNLLPFCGKPLLAHSILYALACPDCAAVYVSTEDSQIAAVARDYGAEVIDRPLALAGDAATTESAIEHALTALDEKPDNIILLQPTSPLRPEGSLSEALRIFRQQHCDSLLSLSPTHLFLWRKEGGEAVPKYNYQHRLRRQDMTDADRYYQENGSLYIFRYEHFMSTQNRLGGKIGHIVFAEEYGYQIDTLADFQFLEHLAGSLEEQQHATQA